MNEGVLYRRNRPLGVVGTVLTHFWFKMFGTMGFTLCFFAAYLFLLRHPASPVSLIPTTWPDAAIGFNPAALPIYLSLWFYVSLPPVLMLTRAAIIGYGARVAVPCLIGLAVFYFWPNAVPPADIDWARYPGVAFLKSVDMAGNACPSLHVATAVFSCVWLHWRLRFLRAGRWLLALNVVWCVAIAYSTMAVKQHVAIDVLAGTLLGLLAAWGTGLRAHAGRWLERPVSA
ncbi:phosphatase PAP2 family protein [Paludibacterium sp.]|uniref:phosphatase PAP2 family protein n=3 Tax=Paludibacterium sp. TaxID=1917523 RepID=UPI0025D478A4|nr:phosphatase PAP2 family protein [Paludibacterium sp.]MBV8649757.1 phosphatase PAP2 family protein [Paludibacterium sp.]